MILCAPMLGAEDILGTDVIAALRNPRIHNLVTIRD